MPAPTTAISTSYKVELPQAIHNHTASIGDVFKLFLYKAAASVGGTHNATDTNYSNAGGDELATASGYTSGGVALGNVTPTGSGTTAIITFSPNPSWTSASFTTSGGGVYNSSKSNRLLTTLSWGSDVTVTAGTLTVQFPVADASNAFLRIA